MNVNVNVNNLVLHLIESYNLRCKYCFMTHGTVRMTAQVADVGGG